MKKEIFIAVFIGLIVGLSITYGIYKNRNFTEVINEQIEINQITDDSEDNDDTELLITNPKNQQIINSKNIKVTGTTIPNSFIIVVADEKEYFTDADESGNFATEVEINNEANIIAVYAVTEEGEQINKFVSVFVKG